MATEFIPEGEAEGAESEAESGGALRAKLEKALKDNQQFQGKLRSYEVKEFLVGKEFGLVKPEDLEGLEPTKWEEKASQIHTERTESQRTLLRQALTLKGFDEDTITELVEGTIATPAAAAEAQASERIRQAGALQGSPLTPGFDFSKLHGHAAIKAGLK